ncbi:MAG: hypothetical protein LBM75_02935 [Myxococcales bacterium]|nr:hypothetical protein [Myxococcales bacterium]
MHLRWLKERLGEIDRRLEVTTAKAKPLDSNHFDSGYRPNPVDDARGSAA